MGEGIPRKQPKIKWRRLGVFALAMTLFIGLGFSGSNMGPSAKQVQVRNDLSQIVDALTAYNNEYGSMPSGDNAKIIAALHGENPKKIVFFEFPEKRLNANGEFLDPWNTPYRIGISKSEFPWAYSCGKNRLDEGGKPGTDDICSW